MAILIGGIVAVVIGVAWAVVAWFSLLTFLAAVVPVILLLGGAIAIYFGVDELRYPAPQVAGPAEPEKAAPPEKVTEPAAAVEKPGEPSRYWLVGYSAENVEVLRDKEMLALPPKQAAVLRERMQSGDRVVVYALAPEAKFTGIVEIASEPARSTEIPFKAPKKDESWEDYRKVRPVVFPPASGWVEAKEMLDQLELLEAARKAGRNLTRSLSAKLREIPELSSKDFELISKALSA